MLRMIRGVQIELIVIIEKTIPLLISLIHPLKLFYLTLLSKFSNLLSYDYQYNPMATIIEH